MRILFLISIVLLAIRPGAIHAQTPSVGTRQGQLATDVALPTIQGDTLRLSNFRGQVVLLDFWASWCGPCRVANKGLTKIYSRYHKKGFEIYSVSLDNDPDEWVRAIKKDKITWKQVIATGSWNAPVARQWNIEAIPTTFLIGRDGRIIAMDLEGSALEKVLQKLLTP
ncbi:MAG: hypothetical protein RJA57_13 [Bacteroidota bacterium]|jgi:peroxiredoxin